MKLEELSQETLDALIASKDALEAEKQTMQKALDKYKGENQKYREDIQNDEHVKTFKERAVKAEAKLALQAQGIKNPDRVLKFLSLDGVDFDDEGNLAGLSDKIDEAKAELPELFDQKRQVGGKGDIFASDKADDTPADPFEARLNKVLKNAGR